MAAQQFRCSNPRCFGHDSHMDARTARDHERYTLHTTYAWPDDDEPQREAQ